MATSELADPIVVIGCFRSGTSSVAMALAALGVYFGEQVDLMPADEGNQDGYWEHKALLRLNTAVMTSLNVPQFDIDFMPDDWAESPPSAFLLGEYEKAVHQFFNGKGLWGYKDPETTLVLPLVNTAFSNLGIEGRFVICVRNPMEVAESEFRRIGHDRMLSIGSWMQHILFALTNTIGRSRTIVVFDELLADQKRVLQEVVDMVPGLEPTPEQWSAALATQRKELVRTRVDRSRVDELPPLIGQTYELLLEAAANQDAFRRGDFDDRIRAVDREYRAWMCILRLKDAPRGSFRVEWLEGGNLKSVKEGFDAKRSWIKIAIEFSAPPESPLRVSLYQTMGTIWIRKAAFLHGETRTPAALSGGQHGNLIDDNGLPWLWPRYGPDQLRTRCPKEPGPYILEMEILVATNAMNINRMWQGMSEQMDGLIARASQSQARPGFR